jgi:hypothetical protein
MAMLQGTFGVETPLAAVQALLFWGAHSPAG